jgi:hypothetical protein
VGLRTVELGEGLDDAGGEQVPAREVTAQHLPTQLIIINQIGADIAYINWGTKGKVFNVKGR